ncbi:MAG TPA: hypothetical protein VH120_12645 [Gemmataceae bacterium]|jgi:hypothetical protein|nr:hypothetical protein [Gemmataceae bacterium]
MAAVISTFEAKTKLKGGHNGLAKGKGKPSKVRITGSGFVKGSDVIVTDPAGATSPTHVWKGTVPQDSSDFTTEVVQQASTAGAGGGNDTAVTVSVTVDDSAAKNADTFAGVPS